MAVDSTITPLDSLVVNGFVHRFEDVGTVDLTQINLTAGTTYAFLVEGAEHNAGTMADPLVGIFSGDLSQLLTVQANGKDGVGRRAIEDNMTSLVDTMLDGQRLFVRSLIDAELNRRHIKKGKRVVLCKRGESLALGRQNGNNFTPIVKNPVEGRDYVLIRGYQPWP